MYAPMSSWLTVQAWETQEQIIDDMGEGLGQLPNSDSMLSRATDKLAELGIDKNYAATCGVGFLAAGFVGYVAGRIGVVTTAAGVGIAYLILKGTER